MVIMIEYASESTVLKAALSEAVFFSKEEEEKIMKKARLLALALGLGLSLAACGGKEPEAKPETEAEDVKEEKEEAVDPAVKYPANVDPAMIHPGSLNSDEDTSDRWYPNGDTSSEIAFTLTQTSKQNDCVGLSFCQYHVMADGKDDDMIDMPLRDGGNGHAITGEFSFMGDKSVTYDYDFTFQDNFTCYDFKNGVEWKRCHPDYGCKDQSWYDKAFAGLVAYRDLSSVKHQQIVFNEDGTFVESVTGMDDMKGHWEVQAANVLMLIYDNAEDAGIQVVDAGSLLENGGENADATSNSDHWQQEFTISAEGKITEFGLFPYYDDNMNLAGYKPAFEVTTVAEMEAAEKEAKDKAAAEEAAEAQAKADALAAGSPYEQPDDKTDLSGVNLDQVPDFVMDGTQDYNTFNDIKKGIGNDFGMIFELHGVASGSTYSSYITVQNDSGKLTQKFTVVIVDADKLLDIVPDGGNVAITGVLWSDRFIYTDSKHVKAE